MKACAKCKNLLSISAFHNFKRAPDGKHPWCKLCKSAYNKIWASKNKEKIAVGHKRWREKNPGNMVERSKNWRLKNPGKVKIAQGLRIGRLLQASLSGRFYKQMNSLFQKTKRRNQSLDHIIPLAGKDICGLNVPWNTQIITKEDNKRKLNWFDAELYKQWLKDPSKPFLRPII